MKDPAGQAAPVGGFQNLGWYSGYQYNNGAFAPQAGQIIASSPQQGAGQAVSAEVNRQTSVAAGKAPDANQNFVNAQNANPNNNPGSAGATPSAADGSNAFGAAATGSGGSLDLSGLGGSTPSLNLPGLYDSLSKSAGIPGMEADLTAKQTAFNDQTSKINDNPFLSESDRVGRIAKLTTDYNNDTLTGQNALTMAKQDIQTQLDLQTKQFDINSQVAQQSLSEFNTLLSSGALAGASGSDIAAITKATGISSSMIQAAISSQTAKDTPTSLTTVDDGKNQYAVVINTKTGQVISKQVLAASKPAAAGAGSTLIQQQQQYSTWAIQDAKNGAKLQDMVSTYAQPGGLSVDQIYQIYSGNAKTPPKETLAQVKTGVYSTQPGFQPVTTAGSTAPGYVAPKKSFNIMDPATW